MTLLKLAEEIAHRRVKFDKRVRNQYVGKAKDERDEYDLTVDTLIRCVRALYVKTPKGFLDMEERKGVAK